MTREEAIKNIREHCYFANLLPQAKEALDMAIKALEQEPTTKNNLGVDAVSRDAVHDMLENLPVTVEDKWFNWLQKACMRLADLPSVTPQYSDEEIDMAQAVEQAYVDKMVGLRVNDVLNKIRAEIEQVAVRQFQIAMGISDLNERYAHIRMENAYRHSLNTIDKYKAESEVEE